MQVCFQVLEHVAGRGADGAGAGERVQVPGMRRLQSRAVSRDETALLLRRECNRGVAQLERLEHHALQEFRVAGVGAIGQCLAQESQPQVAVEELRLPGLLYAVSANELVEIRGA